MKKVALEQTMKPKLILCLALILSGGFLFGCSTAAHRSFTRNDVTLEVSLPTSVRAGQAIELAVNLANKSRATVFYAHIDGVRELGIRLVDSRNATPELTPRGKGSIDRGGFPKAYTKFNPKALKPGESYEWSVDLNAFFKLAPGKYRVSLSLDFNPSQPDLIPFEISADGLEFTIGK